jgi:hypothetical protein
MGIDGFPARRVSSQQCMESLATVTQFCRKMTKTTISTFHQLITRDERERRHFEEED